MPKLDINPQFKKALELMEKANVTADETKKAVKKLIDRKGKFSASITQAAIFLAQKL